MGNLAPEVQLTTGVQILYAGAIAVFTYVRGTMEVHTQGTPEVHFMSRRCITVRYTGRLIVSGSIRSIKMYGWG